MQTAGRSWADIVGSQNLSQGAVPLPHARFGARVARPNSVVLHTQAFKDFTVREVMDAVLKRIMSRFIAQELDMPTLLVNVLYAPNEISNQTITATLPKYGKIVKFGHVRANCLENRRKVSIDIDDETSESNLSNDIGRDEDGSEVSRSSDEDMDPVESTCCKDPGGIRDEVMNGIYNDASQHHPTERGSVQTVENNKRKAEEDVSIPDEDVKVPKDSTD
ncbi:Hypothetical predicted protein [Paramuricea clavata]|uniref:Uncharacterized protein n=1 Tax=Paramuricea clavata TaxID=317549 RepID=A0A6S7GES5_PARCT|nr:Hypothetical predicted protein [Paramuricea clavata]